MSSSVPTPGPIQLRSLGIWEAHAGPVGPARLSLGTILAACRRRLGPALLFLYIFFLPIFLQQAQETFLCVPERSPSSGPDGVVGYREFYELLKPISNF